KQTRAAPRPSQLASNIPPELDDLCAELLEREPGARPSGKLLLERLGIDERVGRTATPHSRSGGVAGREAEPAALESALAAVASGRAAVAVVRAPSGMGKTALVSRFFERVRAMHDNALLLRGRCLEREDVPYKAIDDLIDELSEWWREQPATEAQAV